MVGDEHFLNTCTGRSDATNDDLVDLCVVFSLFLLTFKYLDSKFCLIVLVRRKRCLLFAGDLGVAFD